MDFHASVSWMSSSSSRIHCLSVLPVRPWAVRDVLDLTCFSSGSFALEESKASKFAVMEVPVILHISKMVTNIFVAFVMMPVATGIMFASVYTMHRSLKLQFGRFQAKRRLRSEFRSLVRCSSMSTVKCWMCISLHEGWHACVSSEVSCQGAAKSTILSLHQTVAEYVPGRILRAPRTAHYSSGPALSLPACS